MTSEAQEQPFERVSTEILSLILLKVVSIYGREGNQIHLPEQLESFEACRLVCRHWNNAIATEPIFWSSCSVDIRDEGGPGRREDPSQLRIAVCALRRYFARSGAVPLTLRIRLSFEDKLDDLDRLRALFDFFGSLNRWKNLNFEQPASRAIAETRYPWWLSLFAHPRLTRLQDDACFESVQELTLECESDTGCYVRAGYLPIYKLFPNISRLDIGLEQLLEAEFIPTQIGPLANLTWLRLCMSDFGEVAPETAPRLVHQLLAQLTQLLHFEPSLEVSDTNVVNPDDPNPFGLSELVHHTLTSLVIPNPHELVPLFSLLVFPLLETLVVGEGVWGEQGDGRDHFGCLRRMLRPTPRLHTLQLGKVNVTDEVLTAILCNFGSSLRSLHILPHRAHGTCAFLSQLFERSQTERILPHLASFTISVRSYVYWSSSPRGWARERFKSFDMDVFKTFVEDPRRLGEQLPGIESFEFLHHAELRIHGKEAYLRREG
ncbi:hypothetical protein BKA70DRAFT_1259238 [Coprinopsis sp. MPI-PUGE-AT-0042]|nr:hypothetical protein BKA70DRAFT_1259238 [Coprinopsis sp. MPI-PUGE-AT-0042]